MPASLSEAVDRRLHDVIHGRMHDEPVVVLQGPRTVGKSTLLQALATSQGREIIDLDDLATRDATRADPALFVRGEPPVLIDEFQHVPELLDAIKAELNRDGAPARSCSPARLGTPRFPKWPSAHRPSPPDRRVPSPKARSQGTSSTSVKPPGRSRLARGIGPAGDHARRVRQPGRHRRLAAGAQAYPGTIARAGSTTTSTS